METATLISPPADDLSGLAGQAGEAARLLKALANERRLLVLCRLVAAGEMTVGALAAAVGLSQSALSQHLSRMREEGLVTFRREGQTLFYSIADTTTARILVILKDIYCRPPVEAPGEGPT